MEANASIGPNAGERLWAAQKAQGTGLCVGLDPHRQNGVYELFSDREATARDFVSCLYGLWKPLLPRGDGRDMTAGVTTVNYVVGLLNYMTAVVDAAWSAGIRVFKPQASFYEALAPFGEFVLARICSHISELARRHQQPYFVILDAKRGDIESTQGPYNSVYLTSLGHESAELVPGLCGIFGFDTMTINPWMGEDVLTPALPLLRAGRGVIVVTRSSNPSGTTYQDVLAEPNADVVLNSKQLAFRITEADISSVGDLLKRPPTVCEMVLWHTSQFSAKHGLNSADGVSPIFSVMGSTVLMDEAFNVLRPDGTALIPGFGNQGGQFVNIMPLVKRSGPRAGQAGILSSSRAHNFPWEKKYGGVGDPRQVAAEVCRAVDAFRCAERKAYTESELLYPF